MAQVHLGNGLKSNGGKEKKKGRKREQARGAGGGGREGLVEKSSRQNRPLRAEPSGSGPISDPLVLQKESRVVGGGKEV